MNIDEMINSDDYEIFALGIELKKLENGGSVSVAEIMTYSQNLYNRILQRLLTEMKLEKFKNKNNV